MSPRASRAPLHHIGTGLRRASLALMTMVLGSCGGAILPPAATEDGLDALYGEEREAAGLYQHERYDELEQLVTHDATLREQLDDGRFKLYGLQEFFGRFGGWFDVRSSETYARILRWRSARPRSIAAVLAEAAYWRAYAAAVWDGADAPTLSPRDCQLLRERLARARAVLAGSESFASKNPLWWVAALEVARDLDEPAEAVKAIWRRGIQAFPDYFPLHFTMLQSFDPRVGGSLAAQAAFIDEASNLAAVADRDMLYARLWWTVEQTDASGVDVFARGGVSWTRMKAGFEQLMSRWPMSDWNASSYAYFACRAGDSSTYRKLRAALGDRVRRDAFSTSHSVQVCNGLMGYYTPAWPGMPQESRR